MTLLDNHLEQITLSAKSIGELEFPPPKVFTNAILGHHEITTLIRDTEPHERALFSVDSNITNTSNARKSGGVGLLGIDGPNRRKTGQPASQRQSSAVAKALGNDMLRQIQQSSRGDGKRAVNVEILLQGAEKLCTVYSVAGADKRISGLRIRYSHLAESVAQYEAKVMKQQIRLSRMKNSNELDDQLDTDDLGDLPTAASTPDLKTDDDLRAEEEEVKSLEAKKKALEERVAGIEKDLGGLLR